MPNIIVSVYYSYVLVDVQKLCSDMYVPGVLVLYSQIYKTANTGHKV